MTPDNSSWLDSDDALKRLVALKRTGLSVEQLRAALDDEDPRVREAAAQHADMTSGLLHEALRHPDLATRQAALRHDLVNEKHLDGVLHDPELRDHVVAHPKLTEAQKNRLVADPLTDPDVRESLTKAVTAGVGYVHFPGLSQVSPVEAGPSDMDMMQRRLRVAGVSEAARSAMPPGVTLAYVGSKALHRQSPLRGVAGYYNPDHPAWAGNRAHETQHGVFHRLGQDFGSKGVDNIINHVLSKLNPNEHRALDAIMSHPAIAGTHSPEKTAEEKICYAQSYVNDPLLRDAFHRHLKLRAPERRHAFQALVRGAVQKMRAAALDLKHGDLGLVRKSEDELLKAWVANPSMGTAVPQLPHHGTRYSKIETFRPKLGLYHHVYTMPHFEEEGYTPVLHVISTKPSPFDRSGMVSSASVGVHKDADRLQQEHGYSFPMGGEVAQIHASATSPGLRGHGYGGALYDSMLRYHRGLVSDQEVSDPATRRWTGLHAMPGVRGSLGERGNPKSLHWAHADKLPSHPPEAAPIENSEHHSLQELAQKHTGALTKVSPPMSFPRLGVHNRRETQIIDDEKQLYGNLRRLHAGDQQAVGPADAGIRRVASRMRAEQEKEGIAQGQPRAAAWSLNFPGGGYVAGALHQKFLDPTTKPDEVRSNLQHEDLHGVFGLVQRKYGSKARTLLAQRLFSSLPKSHQHAIDDFHHFQAGDHYLINTPSTYHEEKLASLMNYMNSAQERDRYHSDHDDVQRRVYDNTLKSAFKHLHNTSRKVHDAWLTPSGPKDENLDKAMKGPKTPPRQQPMKAVGVDQPEFKQWFGESKITHPETGAPLRVYHGTTHNFTRFATSKHNPENFWGGGHYFTDSPADVSANYAKRSGPDLKNRVQDEIERSTQDTTQHEAQEIKRQIKQKLIGPAPRVIPAYLRMRNPLMLTNEGGHKFAIDYEGDDDNDNVRETGSGIQLHDAIHRVAPMYNADPDDIWENVTANHLDDMTSGGAHAGQVMDTIRDAVNLNGVTDDEGRLMGGEFVSELAREMGHDGIVHDADRFKGMKGTQGARHYVTWDPANIKGVFNRTWDPSSNEYHKAEEDPENPDEVHDWDQPIPNQHELAMQSIQRMKDVGKKQRALDFFDYTKGKIEKRPSIEPELERHLAGFGVVDPQGYPFDEMGLDLDKPIPGKRSKGGRVPDSLAESKRQRSWAGYHLPYQKNLMKFEDQMQDVARQQGGASAIHGPLCRAAAFLSGQLIDETRFRQALALDLEPEEAALKAAGLEPTPDTLKALRAVVQIQALEGLHKNRGDHTVTGDDQDLAHELVEAMDLGDNRPVQFKGKHTGGMQIVRVDSGKQWLLKPGSGSLSPAAGVREETASQSEREVAFFRVAEAWGLGQWMPTTRLMDIDGDQTAVMELLPLDWKNMEKLRDQNPHQLTSVLEKLLHDGTLHRWAVLDYVLGNPDRHGNNLMVGTEEDGFPVRLIDHGSTFAGKAFNPGHDASSFIPFYLRAHAGKRWKTMTDQERLQSMPRLGVGGDSDLREWVLGLDPKPLVDVLSRYGLRAEPSLERLQKLRAGVDTADSASRVVDAAWLGL